MFPAEALEKVISLLPFQLVETSCMSWFLAPSSVFTVTEGGARWPSATALGSPLLPCLALVSALLTTLDPPR